MENSSNSLAAGQHALFSGDWAGARDHFAAALAAEECAEAHDGLGVACWWLNEISSAHEQRTAAYLQFKQRGDLRRAGLIAAWLAREQVFLAGNSSAMNGWFARAERLLEQAGPCAEQGWLDIYRASMLAPPAELAPICRNTIATAQRFGDGDLEAFASAFLGLAQVSLGQVRLGMDSLDEVMAAATGGEVRSFAVISEIFCVTLSACLLAGDLARTDHWCASGFDFARRHNCAFLSAYCRTTYGALLTASGRWESAEVELVGAIQAFELGHRALRIHAVLQLADLRVCQGRLEEAATLLRGYEDQGQAAIPLARLHLARGEAPLARAVLEQAPGSSDNPALDQAPALLLLVDTLLALGDAEGAHRAADRLRQIAQVTDSSLLLAQADLAAGQVRVHSGASDAIECFQSALRRLENYEQSLLASRARLEMAQLLRDSDWPGAVVWARAALASFERLGATHDADEAAALLRELGVSTGRPPARLAGRLTDREAEVLALLAAGLSNREIAARLYISAKTAEHHVSQILGKLGARSRAEAAAIATSEGLRLPPR